MSFDFNKNGQKYEMVAVPKAKTDFGVFSEKAMNYFNTLQEIIYRTHQRGDDAEKRLMVAAQGCLERLEAFLMQSGRLSEHNKSICEQPAPPPNNMLAFRATIAIFDFETLLFHSRALLDRITFFIAKQIYGQDCDSPKKLKNIINNFTKKNKRADQAMQIIDEAMPAFYGVILDAENGDKSLRSHLIHKSTSGESTTCSFTIHTAPEKRVIRFDSEIKGYPLIGSAWKLSQYIPFISLNLLGVYLGHDNAISLDECMPMWSNNLKCFSEHIDESENGPKFSILTMNPSGTEIITKHLKQSVLL